MSSTRTAALWHFDEPDGVWPSDAAHNVTDLVAPAGLTAPSRATGILGYGRTWAAARGLKGSELVVDALKLRRTMAIEVVILLNGDGTRFVCQRGANTGATAERVLWGLKVTRSGSSFTVQAYWQKSSGAAATVAAASFQLTTDWVYLAAVRRWMTVTSVAVDYYLNGEPLGTVTSADGDIEGGDAGTVFIGVNDGAGTPATGMVAGDIIDELRISSDERTVEELRQVYRRLFVYPEQGGDLVRAFLPPGQAYSKDPSSVVQRELSVEGDGLAHAMSLLAILEEDFLPDRATQTLDRWETVLRLSPHPGDDYATRRARVGGHLKKIHGYSREKIADAIAPLLGCTPAQVTFREFSNRWTDDFAAALSTVWTSVTGGGAAPATSGGKLQLAFLATHDTRWTGAVDNATRVTRGIGEAEEAEVYAQLATITLANTGDRAGVHVVSFLGSGPDHHLVGVQWTGAALAFFHEKSLGGVLTTATYGAPPATPFILRARFAGGNAEISYGTTFEGPWTSVATVATIPIIAAVGAFLSSAGAAPASGGSVAIEEIRAWQPKLRDVFRWLVSSSPAPPTTLSLAPAQALVDALKPAHTQGIVAGTLFLCDDPLSLTDSTLLGS